MFCIKCGQSNVDDAEFCINCGYDLKKAMPPSAPADDHIEAVPAPLARKSRKGLIIGLCCGGAVLIAVAVVLVILLTGGVDVAGQWYNSDIGEILAFNENGTVTVRTAAGSYEAAYTYEKTSGKGEVTVDGQAFAFLIANGQMNMQGSGGQNAVFLKLPDGLNADDLLSSAVAAAKTAVPTATPALTAAITVNPTPSPASSSTSAPTAAKTAAPTSTPSPTAAPTASPTASPTTAPTPAISAGQFEIFGSDHFDDIFELLNPQSEILGLWYEEDGMWGTYEFFDDHTYTQKIFQYQFSGIYTYDPDTNLGTVKQNGSATTESFEFVNDKLNFSNIIFYIRDYVEQSEGI